MPAFTPGCPAGLGACVSLAAPSPGPLPALGWPPPHSQAPSALACAALLGDPGPSLANVVLVAMSVNRETLTGKGHASFRHEFRDGPGKTQICSLAGWTPVLVIRNPSCTLCLPDLRCPPQGTRKCHILSTSSLLELSTITCILYVLM